MENQVSWQKKPNRIRNYSSVKSASDKYLNLFLTNLAFVLAIANLILMLIAKMKGADC